MKPRPDEPPGVTKRRRATQRDQRLVFGCAGLVLFLATVVFFRRGHLQWTIAGLDTVYLGVLLGTLLRKRGARKRKQSG